jgi:hypothetical protein
MTTPHVWTRVEVSDELTASVFRVEDDIYLEYGGCRGLLRQAGTYVRTTLQHIARDSRKF